MSTPVLADFMARVLVREGAWVLEPTRNDRELEEFLGKLRTTPARIFKPDGKSRYRFAERGARGRWFFVWVPDE